MVQYDKDDPPMEKGSTFANMEEFRMALRTNAIKYQFEVKTEKTEAIRFRGHFTRHGCPWAIVARLKNSGKSVMVTANKHAHTCASTRIIKTTMADYHWIAEKAVPIMKEDPDIGASELKTFLENLKDLPVVELADSIRSKTMQLYDKRRRLGAKLEGVMLPAIVHKLNAQSRLFSHFKVIPGHLDKGEVIQVREDLEIERNIVNLIEHTCTCLEWQLSGKPCPHAVSLILTHRNHKMDNYLHPYFSVRYFRLAYADVIPPLTDKCQWSNVELTYKVLPPLAKRSAGRQRKNRFVGCLEKGKGRCQGLWQVKCKGCEQSSHREGSSKCNLTGTKKRKSRAKKGGPQQECTSSPTKRQKIVSEPCNDSPRQVTRSQTTMLQGSSNSSPGPVTRRQWAMQQVSSHQPLQDKTNVPIPRRSLLGNQVLVEGCSGRKARYDELFCYFLDCMVKAKCFCCP